ncbi:MAG TPA: hypothetical protein VGD78_05410 [Chthoniobacterales bacterium]
MPVENSRKSDAVPNLNRYLPNLLEQHVSALGFVRAEPARGSRQARNLENVLKQYGDLLCLSGDEVLDLPRDQFAKQIGGEFRIQVDLARRLGFQTNWELAG